VKAIYNDDMHRVELLLEIKKNKAPDIYADIERGSRIKVSMGVKVPQEMCSYCGAITKGSLANRCDHLKFNMHQQMENGQVVYAINIPPMNFFDISVVRKPADTQGHALFQKVASESENTLEDKIATLVKHMDAIDTLPSAVSVDELDRFRKGFSPEAIVRIVQAKKLIFKPSEALFIGSRMPKEEFSDCQKHCDNEAFIRLLVQKHLEQPPCALMKSASAIDYTNEFIEKIAARSLFAQTAGASSGKKDLYGDPREARPAEVARRAFGKGDYSQYKVNFTDGKSITLSRRGFSLSKDIPEYYVDLVDQGFAHSITGVRANGDETPVYKGSI
jgi:hypothetical protein